MDLQHFKSEVTIIDSDLDHKKLTLEIDFKGNGIAVKIPSDVFRESLINAYPEHYPHGLTITHNYGTRSASLLEVWESGNVDQFDLIRVLWEEEIDQVVAKLLVKKKGYSKNLYPVLV